MARHVITPLYACSFELTHSEYQSRYDDLSSDGYRLVMVDGFRSGNSLRYGGIWVRDMASVITRARHGLTSSEYQTEYDDLRARGHALIGVTGLSSPSGSTVTNFAAVWNDGSWRGHHTHHNMTSSEYQDQFDDYADDGYYLTYVTGYARDGSSRYAAIWSSYNDRDQKCRHNVASADYQTVYDDLKDDDYRIVHVSAHESSEGTTFAGIWKKETGYSPTSNHNMSASTLETKLGDHAESDKRVTCLSGYRESSSDKYAAVWVPHARTGLVQGRAGTGLSAFDTDIQAYMQDSSRNIPGASFALTRNGELIMARGYSWITPDEAPVEPGSIFRVASVSKTLTGAAIIALVEDGEIALSDKLVDLINMPGTISDTRVNDITVEHLLHHVGGWDRDITPDPMSMDVDIATALGISLPITQESIVRYQNGVALDFTPGTVNGYAYSNYGYMLLGLVIESVTGMQYEAYVQQRLLSPLGIYRMRLGRTQLKHRLQGEVLYHANRYGLYANVVVKDAPVNAMYQYGGNRSIENIAAHGGWVASAVDLVRFASAFDDPSTCPILNATSVASLFATHAYGTAGSSTSSYYGCGWYVRPSGTLKGQSHGGHINGSRAVLSRWQDATTNDSFCAALIFNKDDADVDWDLHTLIRNTASTITSWPSTGFWGDFL